MKRYLAADRVTTTACVSKFAPDGCCDWCGKELIGRGKRFCVATIECPTCSRIFDPKDKEKICPECGLIVFRVSDCRRMFYSWWYSMAAFKRATFIRDGFRCQLCGYHQMQKGRFWLPETSLLHCDHIIPVSKGGATVMDNLQTLCQRCNLRKAAKSRKLEVAAGQLQLV